MEVTVKRLIPALLALLLVLAACGDDDGGDAAAGGDDELVSGLTEQILSDTDGDDFPLTNAQAGCFAEGLINEFGGERMIEAMDMEFEEFMAGASTSERRQVVDTLIDCADFGEMLTAEFSADVSPESSKCLADAFTGSEAFRDALANSFGSEAGDPFEDPALFEAIFPAMLECLSPEELLQLGE
jgi:hypothetical protein